MVMSDSSNLSWFSHSHLFAAILQIGLSSTAIASSFGRAISDKKEAEDYNPEDIARSLLRMISNNIGQVSGHTFRLQLIKISDNGWFGRAILR